MKGTHAGPLQTPSATIPPSNKRIEVPACQVMKVEGGRVKIYTHYFDMLTLLRQIGAVKGQTPNAIVLARRVPRFSALKGDVSGGPFSTRRSPWRFFGRTPGPSWNRTFAKPVEEIRVLRQR